MFSAPTYATRLLTVCVLIIVIFGLVVQDLISDSFWIDESYSAWVIDDAMRDPNSLRETVIFMVDSLRNTVERVQSDVHPPLY